MLIDWMLPDMSGLELTRSLKRAKDTEEIPVIMLTARAEEQDKVNGLEGGADDYITKLLHSRRANCWRASKRYCGAQLWQAPTTSWRWTA